MRGAPRYDSVRLDRRVRITGPAGFAAIVWAKREKSGIDRRLALTDPLPTNEVQEVYVIRYHETIAGAGIESAFRLVEMPAADIDKGYRIQRVEEIGRERFLRLELTLL